jgi:hypothetical protein
MVPLRPRSQGYSAVVMSATGVRTSPGAVLPDCGPRTHAGAARLLAAFRCTLRASAWDRVWHRAGPPLPTELFPFHLARGGRGTARAAWPPLPPRALAPAVFRLPSSVPCRVDTTEQLRDRLCHLMVHEVTDDCDERLGSRHASSPLFRARYPKAKASAKAGPLRRRPTGRNAPEPTSIPCAEADFVASQSASAPAGSMGLRAPMTGMRPPAVTVR